MNRWVRRVLAAVALAPPTALLAVNALLNTRVIPDLANQKPERFRLDYTCAWMWIPGRVHVRGLRIDNQDRRARWSITADRAAATIDLLALRDRHFAADRLRGEGVAFVLVPEGPEEPGAPGDAWTAALRGVEVDRVHHLEIGSWTFDGAMRGSGELLLHGRRDLEVLGATFRIDGGAVALEETPVADGIVGTATVTIDRKAPDAPSDGRVTALLDVTGRLVDLAFVNHYLVRAPWLTLGGGGGDVEASLVVVDGRLGDGTALRAVSQGATARFFSYLGTGDGALTVTSADGNTTLALDFLDFTIIGDGEPRPMVEGAGLRLTATTAEVELGGAPQRLDVALEVPSSRIPALEVWDRFVPGNLGLELLGGEGTVAARLDVSTEGNRGSGEVQLRGEARGRLDDIPLRGDVTLDARVPAFTLDDWRFDLSGTSLALDGVSVVSEGRNGRDATDGWWARVALPSATLDFGDRPELAATVDLALRDTVPVLTLFAARRSLPDWARGVMAIDDLAGRGRFRLSPDRLDIPELAVEGDGFDLQLSMSRVQRRNHGALFLRRGPVSVGLGLDGDEREIHLLGARRWYERRTAPD